VTLRQQLRAAEDGSSREAQRATAAGREVEQALKTVAESQKREVSLQEQLDHLLLTQQEAVTQRMDLASANAALASAQKREAALQHQMDQLKEQLGEAQDQILVQKRELASTAAMRADLEQRSKTLQDHSEQLRQQLNLVNESTITLQQHNRQLSAERDALQQEIHSLKEIALSDQRGWATREAEYQSRLQASSSRESDPAVLQQACRDRDEAQRELVRLKDTHSKRESEHEARVSKIQEQLHGLQDASDELGRFKRRYEALLSESKAHQDEQLQRHAQILQAAATAHQRAYDVLAEQSLQESQTLLKREQDLLSRITSLMSGLKERDESLVQLQTENARLAMPVPEVNTRAVAIEPDMDAAAGFKEETDELRQALMAEQLELAARQRCWTVESAKVLQLMSALLQHIENLERELSASKSSPEQHPLAQETAELQRQMALFKQQLQDAHRETELANGESFRQQLAQFNRQLAQARQAAAAAQDQLQKAQEDSYSKQQRLQDQHGRAQEELEARLTRLQDQLAQTQQQALQRERSLLDKIAASQSHASERETELLEQKRLVSRLTADLDALRRSLGGARELQQAEFVKERSVLVASRQEVERRVAQLQAQHDAVQQQLAEARQRNGLLTESLTSASKGQVAATQQVDELRVALLEVQTTSTAQVRELMAAIVHLGQETAARLTAAHNLQVSSQQRFSSTELRFQQDLARLRQELTTLQSKRNPSTRALPLEPADTLQPTCVTVVEEVLDTFQERTSVAPAKAHSMNGSLFHPTYEGRAMGAPTSPVPKTTAIQLCVPMRLITTVNERSHLGFRPGSMYWLSKASSEELLSVWNDTKSRLLCSLSRANVSIDTNEQDRARGHVRLVLDLHPRGSLVCEVLEADLLGFF
jgi:chromosome segregation ATPase